MTPEEQRRGETLEDRLGREEPDRAREEATRGDGQLVDDGPRDVGKDMLGELATGPRDVDEDELLRALGSVEDDEPSMEEAAVRVVEGDAPGGSDDATDVVDEEEAR